VRYIHLENFNTKTSGAELIRSKIVAAGLTLAFGSAHSFDLNDCIINGMKGVSSDLAARAVNNACNQKQRAFKDARMVQLVKEYGEPLDVEMLEADRHYVVEGPGLYSMRFLNKSSEKTVTFIRLEVVPAPGGPGTDCDTTKRRVYAYKVTVKPLASIKIIYPSVVPSNCVSTRVALGRTPTWKDVSFSSSAKPIDKDPFAEVD
jgi:hypothetical protein